jgi:hypothetical protein
MITALQHFISKKGKFVFILLLLLVIVSFVLYLSQGSSVFDLISDGGREKKEFYGYDWNDPDQRRFLNVTSRAAGSVGVLISPIQEAVEVADQSYIEGLQQQMQAAFRANPEEIDQEALQRMFQYMQAWPNFSRDFKIREIARSGAYDTEFLDQSIKARVALEGQADSWDLLPLQINHPGINSEFIKFLTSIDPSLESESNRTSVLSMVGSRFGMTGTELESVLYSSFRDMLIDRIYAQQGFTLPGEVEVLAQQNAFAWDGEVAVIAAKDLPEIQMDWGELEVVEAPKAGGRLIFTFDQKEMVLEFGNQVDDKNQTVVGVPLGKNLKQFVQQLSKAINQKVSGVKAQIRKNTNIVLKLDQQSLPQTFPKISLNSKEIRFEDTLLPKLTQFYEANKDLKAFKEESRTFATAMVFPAQNFMTPPPPADEARLRSYFERNRLDFLPEIKEDNNETAPKEVKFEEVVDEVRGKVGAQDLEDAKRESDRLAQNAALEFLDNLNTYSDRIKRNYPDFNGLRNSPELKSFLADSGAEQKKISFSSKDMNLQSMILGLEKRASEKRSNQDPLVEVESLNEAKFFTHSVRKSRNGHVVFLLDRKTKEKPADFDRISFSTLYKEYTGNIQSSEFSRKVDEIAQSLSSGSGSEDSLLSTYKFEVKNQTSARATFDAKQRSLRAKIEKLEDSRSEKKVDDKSGSEGIDKEVAKLQSQINQLGAERTAVLEVLKGAENLEVDDKWVEIERNEDRAIFGLLSGVYSIQGKQIEMEQKQSMNTNLELSRGMLARDQTIRELLSIHLAE